VLLDLKEIILKLLTSTSSCLWGKGLEVTQEPSNLKSWTCGCRNWFQ